MRIISGEDRGRVLANPPDDRIRPTPGMAREAIFNMFQDRIPGCRFLDLYAGTGSVGLEALSRGAGHVTLVEQSKEAQALLKQNITVMTRSKDCRLATGSVADQVRMFTNRKEQFDLIFTDAPYTEAGIAIRLLEPILSEDGYVIVQRPERRTVGDPFAGTKLECIETRRYGKMILTIWGFPLPEEIEVTLEA